MSASSDKNSYIITRNFRRTIPSQSISQEKLFNSIITNPGSIYDSVNEWLENNRFTASLNILNTTSSGSGVGGFVIIPSHGYNLYSSTNTTNEILRLCNDLVENREQLDNLIEMVNREIFGWFRHRGVWEILLVSTNKISEDKVEFKLVVIRITRSRDTFNDIFLTTRGVRMESVSINGTYDS